MPQFQSIDLIRAEREHHVRNGHDAEHDAQHDDAQLAAAAMCFIAATNGPVLDPSGDFVLYQWPWDLEQFRPADDDVRNLVVAGSLIAAEIDRRLAARTDDAL